MIRTACPLLAAILATSCVTHGGLDRSVSHGSPMTVKVEDVPVHGFQVDVEKAGGVTVSGELLGLGPEGIYVLSNNQTSLVATRDVKKVSVELYDSGWAWMLVWTVLGTASTLSHGFYLILSAPIWIATGSATTGAAGASNDLDVAPGQVMRLWQFARFPAGMPAAWPGVRHEQEATDVDL